jgi:hypothetical protein
VSVDLGILTGGKSVPKIEWTHQISLPADFQLRWTTTDPEWITMEMSTPAKGYIGIGFSPRGGMAGIIAIFCVCRYAIFRIPGLI